MLCTSATRPTNNTAYINLPLHLHNTVSYRTRNFKRTSLEAKDTPHYSNFCHIKTFLTRTVCQQSSTHMARVERDLTLGLVYALTYGVGGAR